MSTLNQYCWVNRDEIKQSEFFCDNPYCNAHKTPSNHADYSLTLIGARRTHIPERFDNFVTSPYNWVTKTVSKNWLVIVFMNKKYHLGFCSDCVDFMKFVKEFGFDLLTKTTDVEQKLRNLYKEYYNLVAFKKCFSYTDGNLNKRRFIDAPVHVLHSPHRRISNTSMQSLPHRNYRAELTDVLKD